jgi:hypothetical protein
MSIFSNIVGSAASIATNAVKLMGNRFISDTLGSIGGSNFRSAVQGLVNFGTFSNGLGQSMDITARSDPLMQFNWAVILPFGLPPMYIEEADIPFEEIEQNAYHQGNRKRYDPGFVSLQTMSITFYEDSNGTVLQFLQNWKKLVQNGGYYGRPADYKKTIAVSLNDNNGNPVVIFQFLKCWPLHIGNISVNSDNGYVRIQVQFSTEQMEYQVVGSGNAFIGGSGGNSISSYVTNNLARFANNAISSAVSGIVRSIF